MTIFAILLLSLAGFASVALSMHKHHRDLIGAPPSKSRKQVLAIAGWALLATSAAPALVGNDILTAFCVWLGVATISALAVAMTITYAPRLRRSR